MKVTDSHTGSDRPRGKNVYHILRDSSSENCYPNCIICILELSRNDLLVLTSSGLYSETLL